MKQSNGCNLDDSSKKQKGRTKKHKASLKLFAKTCWPKVMISRNNFIRKKSKDPAGSSSLSYLEESSGLSAKGEESCCEENGQNFREEQGVCLISSSSEIPCESLQKLNESNEECGFVCVTEEGVTSGTSGCRERPIFVDLTTDERSTWKQTIFKQFDEELNAGNGKQNTSANVALEPQIMIADSSSKSGCNGGGSLATALRDRGSCFIPVQPNRSLPIRPAPCVPARSLRKDCSPLLVLSKSSAVDVVEVEPTKSIGIEFDTEQDQHSNELTNAVDYVVPRISSVGSLSETKRIGEENPRRENRRRRRSQEADSTQREECVEGSIKEFLTNFCGSNANEGTHNSCTDRCSRIVSSSKEEGSKVVPPLRLKKVIRTEIEEYTCRNNTESEHESNYRIVTGTTPRPSSSPVPSSWTDMLCEKDANFSVLNTDSYKLEYRRNKLKQKLQELRGKAAELAKQMASDASSQQSTRLRQVRNRYEKQIENLSKLHSKLSAAHPALNEVIDLNDEVANPSDEDEYFLMGFTEKPMKNSSTAPSPEPPKLSPRSPTNYENMLPEEVRNSPPILPRVSLTISSSQEAMEEELQISDRKLWATEGSLQDENKTSLDFEECVRTTPLKQQYNIDAEDVNEQSSSNPKDKDENSRLVEGFAQSPPVAQETENVKCLDFSEAGPLINLVTNDMETTADIQDNEMLELKSEKQLFLQSNSFEPASEDVPFPKINESTQNAPKVALNQWNQFNTRAALNQGHHTPRQNYKGEEIASNENHLMTEQFPSLGNWLTRMSKKQTTKSKSKLQSAGHIPYTSTENSARISGAEIQKMVAPNTANDSMNTTPQYSTERWQYHHQQQQRQQQLLQHVAASVTLSQPAPTIPPLRSALCPPIPMTPFYPNNYAIDPYNGATLSYHSAICPYGTYPYHSRLHSASLPGYHFPTQESLRPLQHIDKRFPSVQDSMMRYPSPLTSLQHPANIDFDRIRAGGNVGSNVATATCLPSLLISPPSLSSSHQTLPRTSLAGYRTNGQFNRNRMIPDVVAAAAAAAVVAAASINRQRDTLTYNRSDTGIANAIDGDAAQSSKTNRIRDCNFAEETRDNTTKYQQMQNFLYDRLTLLKTADNFAPTNSLIDNDTQATMTSIVSSTPYQVPLTSAHPQLPKSLPGNDLRNCDTPHLGKVSRSPNNQHNLVCSNCGSVGPKFKCLGCELAFYCNERCQEKHWYVHVQRCPKKMPKLKKVT